MANYFSLTIKGIIKKIILLFGLEIINAEKTFDEIHQILNNEANPVIFDVGANYGQSIERFRKIFPHSIIHSFEPLPKEFKMLQENYTSNNTFLNNIAVGSTEETRTFYVHSHSTSSSFNKLNINSPRVKKASEQYGVSPENFIDEEIEVNILTLDGYVRKNNIRKIDILKIDTQGFEDEVLKGAESSLKSNIISTIELELLAGDNYEKRITFFDIEQYLIPYGYRLYAISRGGNLYDKPAFGFDIIYTLDK